MGNAWVSIGPLRLIDKTEKAFHVEFTDGTRAYVPKSQVNPSSRGAKEDCRRYWETRSVGHRGSMSVSRWIWEKAHYPRMCDAQNLKFPDGETVAPSKEEPEWAEVDLDGPREPTPEFLQDYTRKQLLAACVAYRSALQEVMKEIEDYRPQFQFIAPPPEPDGSGFFPLGNATWMNMAELRTVEHVVRQCLKNQGIGEAMLWRMATIEKALGEKRADVAADLIKELDEEDK